MPGGVVMARLTAEERADRLLRPEPIPVGPPWLLWLEGGSWVVDWNRWQPKFEWQVPVAHMVEDWPRPVRQDWRWYLWWRWL